MELQVAEMPRFTDLHRPDSPAADVRLPDAVTVRHGPVGLLSRFFLKADQIARDRGIRLRIRTDMEELLDLNRRETEKGNWYPVLPPFNCELDHLTPENSFWISGVDEKGETVVAQAARLYQWHDSSLADHVREMMYPDPACTLPCYVHCEAAHKIRGVVYFGGSTWIRPDHRRKGLGGLMPQVSRAYGAATWGTDWLIAFIQRHLIELNMHQAYGYREASFGFSLPGSPWGDLEIALARQSSLELMANLEAFVSDSSKAAVA